MGVAQSDWQYHAYNGTSRFKAKGPFKGLRAVFSVHPEPFTVVARADAGIKTFNDLKGKRVNIGNPGSGQRGTMEVVMAALGWTKKSFALASELKSAEQSQALCDNKIDAMVFTVGHPSGSIKEATTTCDSVIVEVSGPAIEKLVNDNDYYRHAVIPGGMYRGNANDTKTFGVGATFVSSTNAPAAIRTAILPFLFIFNTELLMIGIENAFHLVLTIVVAVGAMLTFAAATQGFFLVKCRLWEIAALLLVAFTLFRPGFWWDMVYPALESAPAKGIYKIVEAVPPGGHIRIRVTGENLDGDAVDKTVMLQIDAGADSAARLAAAGLELRQEDGKMIVDNVVFGSAAERQKIDFDWQIASVERKADRPPRQLMYLPALLLFGAVFVLQRRRRQGGDAGAAA